MLEDDQY